MTWMSLRVHSFIDCLKKAYKLIPKGINKLRRKKIYFVFILSLIIIMI